MEQIDLFSYIDEQEPIGKVVIDKTILLSMLQTINDLSGKFNYYIGKGTWYAINTLEHMAVIFNSNLLSVNADSKKYFTIDAFRIKEMVELIKKDNVVINVFEGAISVFSKKISRAFVVDKDASTRVINVNRMLKSYNYIKVKVDPENMVKAIKWVKGTGSVKHKKAQFIIKSGQFYLYDYSEYKDGSYDEAKAIIGNVVAEEDASVVLNTDYLSVMAGYLSKNKNLISDLYVYVCDNSPLIVRGKIELGGKMKDTSDKIKFDFVIAPLIMEE